MASVRACTLVAVLTLGVQGCSSPRAASNPEPEGLPAHAGTTSPASPFANAKVTNLMKQALASAFTPDREVLVDLVEVPPNTTLERHWHPGEEFHYYLEGEPEVVIQGRPTIHAKEGTVGYIPYKAEHVLSTKEKGAKIIVFRVHTAGEPVRHLVDDQHKQDQQPPPGK